LGRRIPKKSLKIAGGDKGSRLGVAGVERRLNELKGYGLKSYED
jgi:hypothetical protein